MIDKEYIYRRLAKLEEVESKLSDPASIANQKIYRGLVREHTSLKRLQERTDACFNLHDAIAEHRQIIDSPDQDPELKELALEELQDMETRLPKAEKELMSELLPPDPADARNVIMEIRAGTGGDEAGLFAGDLFRMYTKYCENRGWKIAVIDASTSEKGGFKEIVFTVEGQGVYGSLKYESGGHRVQRVPETEAQGRIHTSAATVAVFPEVEEDDDIEIKPEEIRVDIFCSSGPGGQSVNTTYSAIRITHLPSGIVVQSQDERSQKRNRDKAMSVLKSRMLDVRRREEELKKGDFRRNQIGSGDRNERIRTYNFPQNRLTDHRINLTLYSLDRIVEGDVDEVITALKVNDVESRLAEEMKKTVT